LSGVAQRFGENLTSAREGSGVTQEELSFRAGLHSTEIGLLERGGRIPKVKTQKQEAKTRSKPTKNKAKTESQEKQQGGPKEAGKGRTQTATTQPPTHYEPSGSVPGRSLVISNVRKALA
jgi:transcriptional regulator with XRE-family HTH domain